MAFDVYVGTMTRFYRREWENVAQRMAREQGVKYTMIHAGGDPEPPPAADEIREAVAGWRIALSEGLAPHGCGPVTWDEGDSQPYFTDRPSWEGYSAMLIWAAHAEHPDLPIPAEVPESWVSDTAFQRSHERDFESRFRTILEPQLWLPAEFTFVFDAPTVASEENSRIGSTFTLKQQLDELWSQAEDKLRALKAAQQPGSPAASKPSFFRRLLGRKSESPEPQRPRLAETAEFGLQIFRNLAAKACEHRLPILLHF
jgi:hypothetical protein